MKATHPWFRATMFLILAAFLTLPQVARAEEDDEESEYDPVIEQTNPPTDKKRKDRKGERRKFITGHNPERSDAGVFHVGFGLGGNFWIEPKIDATTKAPLGEYFKDFGFQAGVYFDYDYSEMDENIPLGLRGVAGYKYILQSIHVFSFEGIVRHMWRFSETSSFGAGIGGSAAVWYRAITSSSPDEEILFLPSFVVQAGFDFTPFMVDFKTLINKIAEDDTRLGFELSFGFRL